MTTTYDELKCEVCGRTVKDTPLFRANPTGEKGRWRCEACLDEPPSDVVLAVTDSIQLGVWPGTGEAT